MQKKYKVCINVNKDLVKVFGILVLENDDMFSCTRK